MPKNCFSAPGITQTRAAKALGHACSFSPFQCPRTQKSDATSWSVPACLWGICPKPFGEPCSRWEFSGSLVAFSASALRGLRVGWEQLGLEVSKKGSDERASLLCLCSPACSLPSRCGALHLSLPEVLLVQPPVSSSFFLTPLLWFQPCQFWQFCRLLPLSIAPWSVAGAWVGGWQLRHAAGPGTGAASTTSRILFAQSCE